MRLIKDKFQTGIKQVEPSGTFIRRVAMSKGLFKVLFVSLMVGLTACSKNADVGKMPGTTNNRPGDTVSNPPISTPVQAELEWSQPLVSFTTTTVNTAREQVVNLKNTGSGATAPLQFAWGDLASPFVVKTGTNTCENKVLAPKESCSLTIKFVPTVNGAKNNVLMATDLITSKALIINGLGEGGSTGSGSAPNLVWILEDYGFGPTAVGGDKTFDFIVANIGGDNSQTMTLSWDNASSPFSLVPGYDFCSNQVLAPGANCKVRVKFNPTSASGFTNTLTVSDTLSNDAMVVTGTGVVIPSQLVFNPTSYSFNQVLAGGQKTLDVTLRNNAAVNSGVITLSWANVNDYSIVSGLDQCSGQILPGGSSCVVRIRFMPTVAQADITNTLTADDTFSSATVSLTGTGADPASNNPVAFNQTVATAEDVYTTGTLTGTDPRGYALTYILVGNATKGNIVLLNSSTGEFRYTPDLNQNGADSFTFRVKNSNNDISAVATVSVNIAAINDPPVAVNDTLTVDEDSVGNVNVLANDSDVEGNILSVMSVTQPGKGSVIINGDNTITYTPQANYSGSDSFSYMVSDGAGGSASAMVLVTVNPINDAPVAQNGIVNVNEDSSVSTSMVATDVDSTSLTYSVITAPTHGTLVVTNANTGAYTYTPNNNYNGTDSFTFKVSDGQIDSNVATVNITVNSINDAPVANNNLVTVVEDTATAVVLDATDADNDTMTYTIVSQPLHGTFSGTAPNLTYTPALNYSGSDMFTFKVNDSQVDSTLATVSINVSAVNDVPVAFDDSFTTNEDANSSRMLSAQDVDGDTLTYTIETLPTQGTVVINNVNTGAYTYTPNANYHGSDSFTFKVNDGQVDSNEATISINVNSEYDMPVTSNMNIQTLQDTAYNGTFNFQDIENDTLTFSIVTNATNGTLIITNASTGEFTYTPNASYVGSDAFTYKITTAQGDSNTSTVTVQVTSNNTAPVADNDAITVTEDVVYSGTLSASDAESNPLNYTVVSQATKGTVWVNSVNGQYTYTPNANANGSDSFTFRVYDGLAYSNTATVSITITPVNDAPVASNKNITTNEDTAVAVALSATDVENSPLTYAIVSGPTHGVLSGTAPNLTYTPNANYSGADSFTYKANDGGLDSNVATVIITVNSVNDAPVASNSSFTTNEDTAKTGFLVATDGDNDPLVFTIVTQPTKGTVSINSSTGEYTYTPNLNANGSDSFTFKVNDGTVNSNTATVSITITPVNDAPVANDLSITVNEDTTFNGNLTATDVEGSSLTYSVVANATHGTVTVNSNGSFSYHPAQDYNGSDSFTFKANDGSLDSNTATVSITVVSHNNLPVAQNQSITTNEDTAKTGTLVATDADNDTLTYSIVVNGAKGTAVITNATTGAFTYTPSANQNGTDAFTFKVYDGKGYSNTATVSVVINPVNDAPVALDDAVSTNRNVAKNIVLVGTDVEGSTLTYTVVTSPTKGVLSGTAPNLIYTPNNNQTGADSFTFKVNDGQLDSNVATISITINNTNQLPVANNSAITTNEDTVKSGNVTATDADNDPLTYSVVTQPTKGTISMGSNGSYTYTPNLNANGSDSFTFKANDGVGNSNTATVSITITPVNDAPVANNVSITTTQNTAKAVTLSASDVDGDTLTYSIVASPTKGSLSGTAPNLTYTPTSGQTGSDSFTYRVNDGTVNSNTATVSITIQDLDHWFDTAWLYRRRIHINNQNFGALTNFPVMVKLDSSRIDYSKTKSGGADLRFADLNGNLLSYEIERWNTTGTSIVWVKIPSIGANSMTDAFMMYYGNSAASDAQDSNSVWSNGYAAVYHMEETTGYAKDSTSNSNNVVSKSSISMNVSGKIAGGDQFTSTSSVERVNDAMSLDLTSKFTIEAWVYQTSTNTNLGLVTKQSSGSSTEYGLFLNNGKPMLALQGASVVEFTNTIPNNTWTYIAATYNTYSNDCQIYSSQGDKFKSNTSCTTNISSTSGVLRLGNNYNESSGAFQGTMDEIRISNVDRSSNWLKAQHQSMIDSYLVFASEQDQSNALLKSQLMVISANNDDGEINQTGSYSNTGLETGGNIPMGQDKGGNNWGFYRFQIKNSIPSGSTITNARLRIYGVGQGSNWNSTSHYLGIRGQKSSNAPQVTGDNQYPGSGITSTTATSSWGSPGLAWNIYDWNQSSNINGIVQELVNTYSGLSVNNYMQLWVGRGYNFSGSSTQDQEVWGEDYSNGGYNQSVLLIEWTQ